MIPTERIVGPLLPEKVVPRLAELEVLYADATGDASEEECGQVIRVPREDKRRDILERFEVCFDTWAAHAEENVVANVGACLIKDGSGRGMPAKKKQVAVGVARKSAAMRYSSLAKGLEWMIEAAVSLTAICAKMHREQGSEGQARDAERPASKALQQMTRQIRALVVKLCGASRRGPIAQALKKREGSGDDEAEKCEVNMKMKKMGRQAEKMLDRGFAQNPESQRYFPKWAKAMAATIRDTRATAKEVDANEAKKREQGWKDFIVKDDPAAAKAHAWTKAVADEEAQAEFKNDRLWIPCEEDVLHNEELAYAELWCAGEDPGDEDEDLPVYTPKMPLLTPEAIRAVSRRYKVKTATPDGIHPRHFATMSDATLRAFALLMGIYEAICDAPPSRRKLQMAMLAKLTGGWRLIGLFDGFFRIWLSCRKEQLD